MSVFIWQCYTMPDLISTKLNQQHLDKTAVVQVLKAVLDSVLQFSNGRTMRQFKKYTLQHEGSENFKRKYGSKFRQLVAAITEYTLREDECKKW
ncbi:hypothetical protein C0J52_01617 [Blattella germanica]|nr:hypothetical protein C0J52_01617 [Blattella germanica]